MKSAMTGDRIPDPAFTSMWRLRWRAARLRSRFGLKAYPAAFDKTQSIFIHVPKVAGLSLCQALYGQEVGHSPLVDFLYRDKNKFQRYFKFAFVRNPWDRLASAFNFLCEGGLPGYRGDRQFAEWIRRYDVCFEDFVCRWLDERNAWAYIHLVPQWYFLQDGQGHLALDFVGRFEQLSEDFNIVATRMGTSVVLPELNKSGGPDYRDMYPKQAMIDKVAQVYARDIDMFAYRFAL